MKIFDLVKVFGITYNEPDILREYPGYIICNDIMLEIFRIIHEQPKVLKKNPNDFMEIFDQLKVFEIIPGNQLSFKKIFERLGLNCWTVADLQTNT